MKRTVTVYQNKYGHAIYIGDTLVGYFGYKPTVSNALQIFGIKYVVRDVLWNDMPQGEDDRVKPTADRKHLEAHLAELRKPRRESEIALLKARLAELESEQPEG